ncbi:DUF4349 domain-containing protein [Chitinophaga lutea]
MKLTNARRIRRTACWFLLYFLLLTGGRLLYGYLSPNTSAAQNMVLFDGVSIRKNYASEEKIAMSAAVPSQTEQKYEKTATMSIRSNRFMADDGLVRRETSRFGGLIQYENAFGLPGRRELHLVIGVNPAMFDSFYLAMQRIGSVQSMSVTKDDKTNEYRQLNATRASLEKTLASLQELKSKSGAIADFIALHDKIIEIESKLQDLGVELGNFSEANALCTVRLSLYEGKTQAQVSFFRRLATATLWAGEFFLYSMIGITLVLVSALLLLLIADKLRVMQILNKD